MLDAGEPLIEAVQMNAQCAVFAESEVVTLIHAMKSRGKSLGLATLCGGGGVSMATAIEML